MDNTRTMAEKSSKLAEITGASHLGKLSPNFAVGAVDHRCHHFTNFFFVFNAQY